MKKVSFKGELVGGKQMEMMTIEVLEIEEKELEDYLIFSLEGEG